MIVSATDGILPYTVERIQLCRGLTIKLEYLPGDCRRCYRLAPGIAQSNDVMFVPFIIHHRAGGGGEAGAAG